MVRIASSLQVVHIFGHLAHILTLIHDFLHLSRLGYGKGMELNG